MGQQTSMNYAMDYGYGGNSHARSGVWTTVLGANARESSGGTAVMFRLGSMVSGAKASMMTQI